MKKILCLILLLLVLGVSPLLAAERQTLVDGDGEEIGTTSNPMYIDIQGDLSIDGSMTASSFFLDDGSTVTGDFADGGENGGAARSLGNTDNYDLHFLTNNTDVLHLKNDGNVGIGDATPTRKLDVNGDVYVASDLTVGNVLYVNGSATENTLSYDTYDFDIKNSSTTVLTCDTSNDVIIANDLTVDTNTLYVDSTNNKVGVGTLAPAAKFEVSGDIKFSDDLTISTNMTQSAAGTKATTYIRVYINNLPYTIQAERLS